MHYIANQLEFEDTARTKVLAGVEALARAVGLTMGAKGRKALIEDDDGMKATLDGISVARVINLKDKFHQIGAVLVRTAAHKTNQVAGDGTTSATVLSASLMREGHKLITAGYNPVLVSRGMEKAKDDITHFLKKMAKPIKGKDDLFSVAKISSREDAIATAVSEVMHKLGKDGVVTIEKTDKNIDVEVEYTEGIEFAGGIPSRYYVNNDRKQAAEMEDCRILIVDDKLRDIEPVHLLLKLCVKSGIKKLVIIAEEVTNDALGLILTNNKNGGAVETIHVNPSEWGERRKEFLQDIAVATGATVITPKAGMDLKNVHIELLGSAQSVIATRARTTIVGGAVKKESVEGRIKEMEEQLEIAESEYEKTKIKERKARFQNGIAVIKAGGATEPAQIEKMDRIEDALGAARSASEEGIIPGGGTAFAKIAREKGLAQTMDGMSKDELAGYTMTFDAITGCLKQIVGNAGENAGMVLKQVQEDPKMTTGWNVMTGKMEDMIEAGIIDPVKVQRLALENAVSVASLFLTMGTAVVLEEEIIKTV